MADANSMQEKAPTEEELIRRFSPSFDGSGFIAVTKPDSLLYRAYRYGLVRVLQFTEEGAAALVTGIDDTSGGFSEFESAALTPIHEIQPGELRMATCAGWPARNGGGMKEVMRRIKNHKK